LALPLAKSPSLDAEASADKNGRIYGTMRQEKQMKFDSLSDRLGTGNVDGADCHFAFRTDDFDGVLAALSANGFREDAAEDDPMHVIVRRNGPAAFPSSSCSIPTATSSRSTAHRSHALRVSRRCERRLR
jgi:hypothetical protein